MELYILRHGDAQTGGGVPDAERALTEEGCRQVKASARALSRLTQAPPAVLSSPLARARESAEMAAAEFAQPPEIEIVQALAPPGDLNELMGEIEKVDRQSVLLVGHEPFLGRVIYAMIAGPTASGSIPMSKAALARVDLEIPVPGEGRLIWLMPPQILRGLASKGSTGRRS